MRSHVLLAGFEGARRPCGALLASFSLAVQLFEAHSLATHGAEFRYVYGLVVSPHPEPVVPNRNGQPKGSLLPGSLGWAESEPGSTCESFQYGSTLPGLAALGYCRQGQCQGHGSNDLVAFVDSPL